MIWISKKPRMKDPGPLVVSTPEHTYNRGLDLSPKGFEKWLKSPPDRESFLRRAIRETFRKVGPEYWRDPPIPKIPKIFTTQGEDTNGYLAAAGPSLNTFTTAKSILNSDALTPLPALRPFWYIGKTFRITAIGGLGNVVTTPGLIAFQVMIGPTVPVTIIAFTTGNIQLNATAHTNLPFWVDIILTLRATGSGTAADFMGMGRVQGIMFTLTAAQTDAVNTGGIFSAPATAPAVGTGFDCTIGNFMDFFAGFTISNASNTIQIQLYMVEALN